jgi:hypothetical protein
MPTSSFPLLRQQVVEIQLASVGGDEHARVDQDSHRS